MLLLVVQVLDLYKPPDMTRYGWRKQQEQRAEVSSEGVNGRGP
jgi:hypothetical protein